MDEQQRKASRHHRPQQPHGETWHTPKGRAIREVVFGMTDGVVTTIGFLTGIHGSEISREYLLLAAMAEAFAGTLSMAFGAYLSSKSQKEYFEQEIAREKREIVEMPSEEIQEIREIFRAKGFKEEEVDIVVKRITADQEQWLKFMLREELGLFEEQFDNPVKIAAIMGISFFVGSFSPIIPYFFTTSWVALVASLLIGVGSLFALGAGKTRLTRTNWLKSGLEMTGIGTAAAAIGYLLGSLASRIT
ncbi:MAG: VIT1/CCC1 transporter family protein [Nitrospinae bacterium]|nr:VIT1/CCC1 transporter family protein [Nitrospinota bacterium]